MIIPTAAPLVTLNVAEPVHPSQFTVIVIEPTGPGVSVGDEPSLGSMIPTPSGSSQLAKGMLGIQPFPYWSRRSGVTSRVSSAVTLD